ncbi:MAG: peptidase [Acidimicrobiales bacterium]|nr:MAG: peptidase [Acidimicrobiales bacterium]
MSAAGPERLVDAALAGLGPDGGVVIVEQTSAVNVRFANTTLTTNGTEASRSMTVAAVDGDSLGVVASSAVGDSEAVARLVTAARTAAAENPAAEDAAPLLAEGADPDFELPPERTGTAALAALVDGLGAAFDLARSCASYHLYGFVRHELRTTYVATSAGLRRRHVQPTASLDLTARSLDGSASAWAGQGAREMGDVDVTGVAGQAVRRLAWAGRRLELAAGRYETLLPPAATADLMAYLYWSMSARAAVEGRTALSRPGGQTKVGERVAALPVTLSSDPGREPIACIPFLATSSSSEYASVFDNGLPVGPTDWVREGVVSSLITTRHTADLAGLAVTPPGDNLVLEVGGAEADMEAMIASTERGLLLTCLWYIRQVDPQTLLLTGLTRDGVFLVEGGEVVGAVNNFRFNESLLDLLGRIVEAGRTVATLPREFQEELPRAAMPPLRVAEFNMSSVSQAS